METTKTKRAVDTTHMTIKELQGYCTRLKLAPTDEIMQASKKNLAMLARGDIMQLPEPEPVEPAENSILEDVVQVLQEFSSDIDKRFEESKGVNNAEVKSIFDKAIKTKDFCEYVKNIASPVIKNFTINLNGVKVGEIKERTHKMFPKILKLASAGLPILMVGPAGTGKTHLASQVAKALGRPFTYNSMSAGVTENQLAGCMLPQKDGSLKFEKSGFVNSYENGGVHLFDEVDAADANVMTFLNSALANGHMSVYGGRLVINRHPNTVILCAANTFGTGASRQYVGRNQLDAATLDRFAVSTVVVDYDKELEMETCKEMTGDTKVVEMCWKIRNNIMLCNMKRIMSTRSVINMCKRVSIGDTLDEIRNDFFQSWTREEVERVRCW